ncbi:MAG: (2Fe-2S) ferredoxin domain-containing protein [Erysipelotrichaceae bacterium]|jgi:NADH:ubiquinone oxidoreductase subunit E|nr:(2Fe-2S) ferredoxin domain-containing protein [Erysipelotrichaceae bacterium]
MINVDICFGRNCYANGAYDILPILNRIIKREGWEDKVKINGSLCMRECSNEKDISIKINGKLIEGITLDNIRLILNTELKKLI